MKLTRNQLRKMINESVFSQSIDIRTIYTNDPIETFNFSKYRNKTPTSRNPSAGFKPNGLWYACNNEWKEWVSSEMPSVWGGYKHKYEIEVVPDTRGIQPIVDGVAPSEPTGVLMINNIDDFHAFIERYGVNLIPDINYYGIDWGEVSYDFHGIEICPFMGRPYDSKSQWYYGWDIASGCIWNKAGIASINEVPIDN